MMTGFKKTEVSSEQAHVRRRMEQFNKFFSGVRISVERAFGILKARFKSLQGVMHVRGTDALEVYFNYFTAACILHNVCADKKVVRIRSHTLLQYFFCEYPPPTYTHLFHPFSFSSAPPSSRKLTQLLLRKQSTYKTNAQKMEKTEK